MKHLVVAALMLLFCTPNALAQQETPEQKALIHRGNVKIWIGIVLVGVGAAVGPLTAAPADPTTTRAIGLVTVMTGATVIAWGSHDRYKAFHPETTVDITLGRTTGIQIRRVW